MSKQDSINPIYRAGVFSSLSFLCRLSGSVHGETRQHIHLKHSSCLRTSTNERKLGARLCCSPVELNAITTVKMPPFLKFSAFLKAHFNFFVPGLLLGHVI